MPLLFTASAEILGTAAPAVVEAAAACARKFALMPVYKTHKRYNRRMVEDALTEAVSFLELILKKLTEVSSTTPHPADLNMHFSPTLAALAEGYADICLLA
jgi:hypothetical protein